MSIDDIVNIQISRETTAVQRKGFGVGLFIDATKVFPETFRVYTSATQVLSDGFALTSAGYLAAALYFGQEVSPTQMVIGRQDSSDTVTITATAAVGSGVSYTTTLNDGTTTTAVTYVSVGADTAITAAAGVAGAALSFGFLLLVGLVFPYFGLLQPSMCPGGDLLLYLLSFVVVVPGGAVVGGTLAFRWSRRASVRTCQPEPTA